jgi:prepilin-type processing-associated H-X9-DG protein
VDFDRPLAGLGDLRPGGFNALFVDGSVHFTSSDIDPDLMRALLTYEGREVVSLTE